MIFLVVLPPLLRGRVGYSVERIQIHFVSVFMLAFGLVGFNGLGVAKISAGFCRF